MSSVFLYLGIVAIWAFVLVPRWLRRHHAAPQTDADSAYAPGSQDYAEYEYEPQDEADEYAGPLPADPEPAEAYPPKPQSAARPISRSKVLQARRRLLTLLVLLAAVAAACTALKLTSWWACIPPAGMLLMYLVLLREAALADAEQARKRAVLEDRQWAAYRREQHATWQAEEEPSAQIIDISARVGDQLYDQYADATERAVGD